VRWLARRAVTRRLDRQRLRPDRWVLRRGCCRWGTEGSLQIVLAARRSCASSQTRSHGLLDILQFTHTQSSLQPKVRRPVAEPAITTSAVSSGRRHRYSVSSIIRAAERCQVARWKRPHCGSDLLRFRYPTDLCRCDARHFLQITQSRCCYRRSRIAHRAMPQKPLRCGQSFASRAVEYSYAPRPTGIATTSFDIARHPDRWDPSVVSDVVHFLVELFSKGGYRRIDTLSGYMLSCGNDPVVLIAKALEHSSDSSPIHQDQHIA